MRKSSWLGHNEWPPDLDWTRLDKLIPQQATLTICWLRVLFSLFFLFFFFFDSQYICVYLYTLFCELSHSIQIGKETHKNKTNEPRATKNKQIVSHVTPHTPKKRGKSTHQLMALPAEDNIIRVGFTFIYFFSFFWVDWAGRHRPPLERGFIRWHQAAGSWPGRQNN